MESLEYDESWVLFSTSLQSCAPSSPLVASLGLYFPPWHWTRPSLMGRGIRARLKHGAFPTTGFSQSVTLLFSTSSNTPLAQASLSPALWMPSQWHEPKTETVTCLLTSQIFTESLLGTRDPAARLRPTAYSGGHGCQSSCPHEASSGMSCPKGPRLLSHFPSLLILNAFQHFTPFSDEDLNIGRCTSNMAIFFC